MDAHLLPRRIFYLYLVLVFCTGGCATKTAFPDIIVLVNGTLIDGSGSEPLPDVVVVIEGDLIIAVGAPSKINIPAGARTIDVSGAFILPGFINAHVHDAFDKERLEAWAKAGVTTVRDEGLLLTSSLLGNRLTWRDQLSSDPRYARLVSAGSMISPPDGYGQLSVKSPENAREKVQDEISAGVDLIKISMESGYAGRSGLPLLSDEELAAIIATAHAQGLLVSAHVTQATYLGNLIEAGVDDMAHIPYDFVPEDTIQRLVAEDIYVVPTLTVLEAYRSLAGGAMNLRSFIEAGVPIALGNDYTLVPQNGFDHFDQGMPMHEIERMSQAGMTPMQIIISATRNAAHVCGLEASLGTLEVGKVADILILNADPLQDIQALIQVRMVIHNGVVIFPEESTNPE